MTKWYTLGGRFTDEEIALIKSWQKKLELNDNQIVRAGIQTFIGFISLIEMYLSPEFMPMRKFTKESEKFSKSPEIRKAWEKMQQNWILKYQAQLETMEKAWKKSTEQFKPFKKHQKRGRKRTKRKRGRPKDKGYN